MFVFPILLSDLPGFSVERIERDEKAIHIIAHATPSQACYPDCQQASSRVHSYYTRSPMDLPSSEQPISLVLLVRHFRCSNGACSRKTFAEPFPHFLSPYTQRTSRLQERLRKLGEATGGEAGAHLSKQQAMAKKVCTEKSTSLRETCSKLLSISFLLHYSNCNLSGQNGFAVFRTPHKMIGNVVGDMFGMLLFHVSHCIMVYHTCQGRLTLA
jgi:hypothetical protein